ncbi:hypothetical protein C6P46_000992, partial [Rhodotorula mucilaginosa]
MAVSAVVSPAATAAPHADDDNAKSTALDPAALATRQDIEQNLAMLSAKESDLDEQLANLIQSRGRLTSQLRALENLRQVVRGISDEAGHMANEVAVVAETADRVGAKVRGLDEEQSRVKECIDMVQAVQDLKSAIASLDAAMQKQDWESATRSMQRAMAIDADVISSGFAEAVVPTADLPSTPAVTLSQLRASLLETFVSSFRTAAAANDTNNINRYFKLFPIIQEDSKGLEVYAEWVSGIVRAKTGALSTKSQSPTHFSALLTTLFEAIALILSQHQPVVEKYYGEGKMISVAGSLMSETDQIGLKVLANWEDERRIRKRVGEVRAHRFAGVGVLRKAAAAQQAKTASPHVAQGGFGDGANGPAAAATQDEGEISPRETDAVLSELTMMSGRWQLLRRFLYSSLQSEEPPATTTAQPNGDEAADPEEPQLAVAEESALGKAIAKQLNEAYLPLEVWYLRSAIERAHLVDEPDLASSPNVSSSLDDIFFIVKKVLHRVVSTANVANLLIFNKELRIVLDQDVAEIWRARIEGAFKDLAAIASSQNSMAIGVGGISGVAAIAGRGREEERERREKEARTTFIVYLNDLDTAASYTSRLIDELVSSDSLASAFFLNSEFERARNSLSLVRNSQEKFHSVVKAGLEQLFNQLVRPKLRPLLSEVYKDVSYKLDEDGYNEAEYRDEVRKRFAKGWDGLLSGFQA